MMTIDYIKYFLIILAFYNNIKIIIMGNEQGGGKKGKKKAEDQLFDAALEMKMQARSLEREAQKVQQTEAKERKKILEVSYHYNRYYTISIQGFIDCAFLIKT